MSVLKCQMCAGTLTLNEEKNCYICDFCDTPVAASRIDNEKLLQLKERANKLFLSCDFDGAAALYQSIVSEETNDAESYWLLALCTYGIQYVNDPATGKRIPTCHRASYSSILNNEDYLNALDCADTLTGEAYKEAATRIDEIQRGILSIVSKEPPYDIFICYKETENDNTKTRESETARDLYYKLTMEGYRVFYAPITLQDKAGLEFEPFIFSALNSAKLMFVIGFTREHYDAVWVKNEWSRFLARKEKNPRLYLIPYFNSYTMNADELPEQLKKTQARDQISASTTDLVSHVKTILPKKKEEESKKQPVVDVSSIMGGNAMALLKRGFIYLEDEEFSEAASCFNKSLDLNPEISSAYWGLLLTKHKCKNNDALSRLGMPIEASNEFKKAVRFANDEEKAEYQKVVDNIYGKIHSTINRLLQNQAKQVMATGVADQIKTSKATIERIKKTYKELLEKLHKNEFNIRNAIEKCKKAVDPLVQTVSSATSKITEMLDKITSKELISDDEKQEIVGNINRLNDQINKAAYVDLNATKKANNCFGELKVLLGERAAISEQLDSAYGTLSKEIAALNTLLDKMEKIKGEHTPAIEKVAIGNYTLAAKILGYNP